MVISFITAYILGTIAGFLASIPLGPIGILCTQRTLSSGRISGFISGAGAALADTIFATLALFCLTYINAFLEKYDFWVQVVGGIILIVFGFYTFHKKVPRTHSITHTSTKFTRDYISNFLSVLLLTLTNPAYFLVYAMIFAALGMGGSDYSFGADFLLLLGVYTGTNLWWFILTFSVDKLRSKFTYRGLLWLNWISGGIIMGFGVWGIIKVVIKLLDIIIEKIPISIL